MERESLQQQQQQQQLGGVEQLFCLYGVRYYTAAKIAELGFTARTLVNMADHELDDMMTSLSHLFRWDLLVGERYGIKAAVRAERRRLLLLDPPPPGTYLIANTATCTAEGAVSGGGEKRKKIRRRDDDDDDDDEDNSSSSRERQREHPFIVTEPGEVARGKKNGLDYLFHLYEQCRELLTQVQKMARERGDKCPTKVTNEVFRYAKAAGAHHINKPKMRHYVHCYALHCLDQPASDALRRSFKERGDNVGAWRLACYAPLVAIAARHANSDIDSLFNSHPLLSVWYVPTKLRHLCHQNSTSSASSLLNTTLYLPTPPN